MSVRELVTKIQIEMRSGDVPPARARELLMMLTSLMGNCNVEVQRTEAAYLSVFARCLDEEKKANRAEIRAQLSQEFNAKQDARNTLALVVEMIRSLKVCLRSLEEEMRLSR